MQTLPTLPPDARQSRRLLQQPLAGADRVFDSAVNFGIPGDSVLSPPNHQGPSKSLRNPIEVRNLKRHQDLRDEAGHAQVVRNGRARARDLLTPAGAIEVRAPRVDDRRLEEAAEQRERFRSSILPP